MKSLVAFLSIGTEKGEQGLYKGKCKACVPNWKAVRAISVTGKQRERDGTERRSQEQRRNRAITTGGVGEVCDLEFSPSLLGKGTRLLRSSGCRR
jgi:hypothetical protein